MKTFLSALATLALGATLLADASRDPILGSWSVFGVETVTTTIDGVPSSESHTGPARLDFGDNHHFRWTNGWSAPGKWHGSGSSYSAHFEQGLQAIGAQLVPDAKHFEVLQAKATQMRLASSGLSGDLKVDIKFRSHGSRVRQTSHGSFQS